MTVYKGCKIYRSAQAGGLWVWDELLYGAESDDAFDDLGAAKADVDRYFGDGPGPRVVCGEIIA